MAFIEKRKTIFDIIREADEDNNAANTDNNTDAGATEAPADDNTAGEAESTSDDDLSIDTNLDDIGGDDSESGSDDFGSSSDDSSMDSSSSSDSSDSGDGEVNKANTDIFSSLTAEEQSIKIMELKKLYNNLYTSCDDLLAKIRDIDVDNIDIRVTSRITDSMYQLKLYIKDYILDSFPIKSYYENDVMYNRFLTVFTTITSIFNDVADINDKESDKK